MMLFSLFLVCTILSVLAVEYYDPVTELCCNGIKIGCNNRVTRCCGNKTYDIDYELCCNDLIVKIPLDTKGKSTYYSCCNGKAINKTEYFCCENTIVPIPKDNVDRSENKYYCCGKEIYNRIEALCCDESVIKIPKDNATRDYRDFYCCGKGIYYAPQSICCRNKTYERTYYSRCCGDKTYERTNYSRCCGDKAYDMDKLLCCDDVNLQIKTNSREICCNEKVIDSEVMDCIPAPNIPDSFSAPLFPKETEVFLCNGELYLAGYQDNIRPLCCGDKLYYVEGKEIECCGSKLYNDTDQRCCKRAVIIDKRWVTYGIVHNRSPCQKDGMVCGIEKWYDPKKEGYCNGEYMKLAEDVGERKQLCCRK